MPSGPSHADARPRIYIEALRDGSAFWRTVVNGHRTHAASLGAAFEAGLESVGGMPAVVIFEGGRPPAAARQGADHG